MNLFNQVLPNFSVKDDAGTHHPENYLMNPDLIGAVNVAIASGQPLLLTGEPGTGKTQLAYKLAYELNQKDASFLPEPLVFNTKTTSTAQELFYFYDALGHFQQANIKQQNGQQEVSPFTYINLQALGKAIALTHAENSKYQALTGQNENRNSVVLIDEIDKAPRDFPNDILNEIDKSEFSIKEAENFLVEKGEGGKILVIMTSNSEKNLPEPFLRRCIYFHIDFPDETQLLKIVKLKLGKNSAYSDSELIRHFLDIRSALSRKKPATAELVTWLKVLELAQFMDGSLNLKRLSRKQKDILRLSYSAIAKNKEDLELIRKKFL